MTTLLEEHEFSERPIAPSRSRRSVFATEADLFLKWVVIFADENDQLKAALLELKTILLEYKTAAEQAASTATEKEALMSPHYDNIDAVSQDIDSVNAAAADINNINAVAAKLTQLQTVVDNISSIVSAAANASNINTVASIETAVNAVAGVSTELQAVYANLTEILQADDNAQAASQSAGAAYNSAQAAAQSAQDALNAAAGQIIDDAVTASNKSWSSQKISDELDTKQPKSQAAALASGVIDAESADIFRFTVTADTTFSVSNLPAEPISFVLEITNGGAYTIGWWPGVTWSDGIPPVLTASGTDVLGFYHADGVWRGLKMAKGVA
ncbi:hypothetical protein AVO42_00495 [Thiomicrospira sp. XS5]|uniref:hypothetical protein n=1 Tax=Thiomicrospira sp. XS5 TaxID=1775636 RepID=UPI0007472E83|nr:hypothetical protein [Thiomicrospira sp. XS5]KUJ73935.1 hypothetical protein AVO42_00495 [Thiomicrospira sp. XS5]